MTQPIVGSWRTALDKLGYPRAFYLPFNETIKSELAVPIYSNGHRSGVLNLEAADQGRFSDGHIEYTHSVAEHIGWVISEVSRRNHIVTRFQEYFSPEGIEKLTLFLRKRRAVAFAELKFALCELDYTEGQLIAHSLEQPLRLCA